MKEIRKQSVAVLGATGAVGQQFVKLLAEHPWFAPTVLAASEGSVGMRYGDRVPDAPASVADCVISACVPAMKVDLVFSALDASVAGPIEQLFVQEGHTVVTNARTHRWHPQVPLVIPEVNPEALALLQAQPWSGRLVANPNCSTMGLTLALKPLYDAFGIEAVSVTTLQAISGAGYPGVPSMDMIDNLLPNIEGEEEKIESEPHKILGSAFPISAQTNRVPVVHGHTLSVSVKLTKSASPDEAIEAWLNYSEQHLLNLPTAPTSCLSIYKDMLSPQPRAHRDAGRGMSVSIGRVRACPVLGLRFVALSHNLIRGAAGNALLIGEMLRSNHVKDLYSAKRAPAAAAMA